MVNNIGTLEQLGGKEEFNWNIKAIRRIIENSESVLIMVDNNELDIEVCRSIQQKSDLNIIMD